VALHHLLCLPERLRLLNDVSFIPGFDELANYLVNHESALETPLTESKAWRLRLGIRNEYNNRPADDNQRLDTSYFTRIVWAF